jgi:hypothetical protein
MFFGILTTVRRITMSELTRRDFGKETLKWGGALSILAVLNIPEVALAFKNAMLEDSFLQRDDIQDALKSLYTTYDTTSPYPHKFNETLTKGHLRAVDFFVKQKGLGKQYVEHYVTTMEPLLARIKKRIEKEGPDKGLEGMFEGTTCSYQLFENINIKPGERSFPCPYKEVLGHIDKWLGTFTITWEDVCNNWCIPTWSGFAEKMEIKVAVQPGDECSIKLV